MPGATIWKGTLSFVLVSIPVQLVSAVSKSRVSFHLMHKSDKTLLQRRMFCPKDNTFVHNEHILNGYEVGDNKFVVVRDNEYKALEPKRSQSIEVSSFIDYEQIDPIYFDRPYHILPGKGGTKSYQMLLKVLKENKKAGLAKFVLHTREHLAVVKAGNKTIDLMMLHFYDEVRDSKQIWPGKTKEQSEEVKAITKEMKKIKGKYEPETYIDENKKQILEFLKEKAKQGQTAATEKAKEERDEVPETKEDLVSILEESLSKVKSK